MRKLDADPNVIKWASEEIVIRYYDHVTKKHRRYFPDFYYETKDNKKIIVEVKPYAQTQPPVKGRKKQKTFLNEVTTYNTNMAKWKYAIEFCKKNNIQFQIMTEKDLFPKHK